MHQPSNSPANRREFLRTSTAAAVGGAVIGGLGLARNAHAAGGDTLKVGLIGCGGRGSGAAVNALGADANVQLTAMGDMFSDRIEQSLKSIKNDLGDRAAAKVNVTPEACFTGFDSYQRVINSGVDVVILATPSHFRPVHLQAAVADGKHCFVEKPVAVDAPGVRSILATCEEAKQKGLSVVSGLCWRYDLPKRETLQRVHDGAIGDILAMQANYLTSTLKYFNREPSWSDMEWQLRNWQYFNWLSGDHIVEQHIHSLDKAAWAMHEEPPVKCIGIGGKQVLSCPKYGNNFDHFSVVYEYAGGQKLFSRCRQIDGCAGDVTDYLIGTKGTCAVMKDAIDGETKWRYRGPSPSMYQQEHDELFASIRSGQPINNGLYMARSTMMAIMGRMSAYTGKEISWEQAMNSQEDLSPSKYELGPLAVAPVAMPGVTKFV